MRGAARIATYLGRILMAVGFLLIILAWNNAAELDYIQGQFPFLMSGSIPGMALIVVGAGLEYVQAMRTFTARRAKQMAELNVAVVRLVGFVRDNGGLPRSDGSIAPVPVGVGAVNGGTETGAVAAPAATGASTGEDGNIVVAGRSSFHRPACHLVSGRDDMNTISHLQAEARGLSACRVCKP